MIQSFLYKLLPPTTMHNEGEDEMHSPNKILQNKSLPDDLDAIQYRGRWWPYLAIAAAFLIALFLIEGCAAAQGIPEDKAIKCVIGEAEDQGFEGMLAVSHALRNRGSLKGCYGLVSPRVRHHLYSRKILVEATLAWKESAMDFDITHGATGWGNKKDILKFCWNSWWSKCDVTAHIGGHYFYKQDK